MNKDLRPLKNFTSSSHLKRQELTYCIYVIKQTKGRDFNTALLFQIDFQMAMNLTKTFHDFDFLQEDDRNLYKCPMNVT